MACADTCRPGIVTWKEGDALGVDAGEAVTLRLELKQAKLYGLEWE
jgi:hypothetical protein